MTHEEFRENGKTTSQTWNESRIAELEELFTEHYAQWEYEEDDIEDLRQNPAEYAELMLKSWTDDYREDPCSDLLDNIETLQDLMSDEKVLFTMEGETELQSWALKVDSLPEVGDMSSGIFEGATVKAIEPLGIEADGCELYNVQFFFEEEYEDALEEEPEWAYLWIVERYVAVRKEA